jgi:glucose/arabinose dehydrogenase
MAGKTNEILRAGMLLISLPLMACAPSGPDQNQAAADSAGPDAMSAASMPAGNNAADVGFASAGMQLKLEELVRTGEVIWAVDFIGPQTMIFTERTGQVKLLRLDSLETRVLAGGPEVMVTDSGGLFDVLVDPDFSNNQLLYFTYVKAVAGGSAIALARARYAGDRLIELTDLFVANNPSNDHAHWGSRVVMDGDRFLFMTSGDRHEPNNAQDLASHGGKVLRLNSDGSVPADNPFVDDPGAAPEVWSFGHRNPQGLLFDTATGRLIEQEHGPTGGDEINVILRGRNYGWPVITWGQNIWGGQLPEGTEREGMEQPLKYFLPGNAPTGITLYRGNVYPGWQNSLFSGTLRMHVHRLELAGDEIGAEEQFIAEWGERLRDIAEGPDGLLYLASETGAIARIMLLK